MFQLSKKVEYGLIAIRHMAAGQRGQMYTTKEIAGKYNLPYELLAKVMQKLVHNRLIASYQGVNGGYALLCDPNTLKVSSIIEAIEGKASVTIVECEAKDLDQCTIHNTCTIKDPLVKLQGNINQMLENMTVMQLV